MKVNLKHKIGYALVLILIVVMTVAVSACSSASKTAAPAATSTAPTTPAETTTPPATNPPQRQGVAGTLNSINGNTLTLTNAQGNQITVNIDDSTTIQKTVTGTLSDLQQGDSLIVAGAADANGNITATTISIRPAGQGFTGRSPGGTFTPRTPNPSGTGTPNRNFGNFTIGTLNNINGDSLTLTNLQGNQITVTVTDSTVIDKTVEGTVSDLQPGETLIITEAQDASGNMIARTISIRPQGQGFPAPTSGTSGG